MTGVRRGFLAGLLLVAFFPRRASAHEIAGRFTAPIPLGLLFGGAAFTVALTALLLARTVEDSHPDPTRTPITTISSQLTAVFRMASRGTFLSRSSP